jgi:hypothetical protein
MTEELAQELLYDMSHRVPDDLIRFGRALEASGALTDGWAYFLGRAEKWSSTYTAWCNLDKPETLEAETLEATL